MEKISDGARIAPDFRLERAMASDADLMSKVVSLCKRRGFIFQSSEIYGGLNSCYDYGPLGVDLKSRVKDLWWQSMTGAHDNIKALDSSILMHPKIWEASGHVENFTDPLVDCKTCKARIRADQMELIPCGKKPSKKASECGGEFTEARHFNLMFKTFMGPLEESSSTVFLRPETAQGIYVNFLNVMKSTRQKIPFGIAQIGKAFRNEITPGNFVFRMREFEQMEMQYFVKPGTDEAAFEEWKESRIQWHRQLGIREEKLKFHAHSEKELAHYAKMAFDIEYEFPFGWQEIEGIHHRGDFDLSQHQKFSGKKLSVHDVEAKESYVPQIIETSVGADRVSLTVLVDAFREETVESEKADEAGPRTVLKFSPAVAPYKVAIFPLLKKEPLQEKAQRLYAEIRKRYRAEYDEAGSIGKRYRRVDEIGTPYALTIDFEEGVTIRDRDSMKQTRVSDDQVIPFLDEKLGQYHPFIGLK